jgi:hypothetical protein
MKTKMLNLIKKFSLNRRITHIRDLRRFKKIVSPKILKKSQILNHTKFSKNPKYSGEVFFIRSNLRILATCYKSGSWVKIDLFGKIFSFWTSRNLKYFPILPKIEKTRNFGIGIITDANLHILKNVKINKTNFLNSLNIYNQAITRADNSYEINDAFYLCVNGGDQFQHFVQDLLPILAHLKPELNKNPKFPILLNKPVESFRNYNKFFDLLGITNPKVFLENGSIKIKNLYYLDFKSKNAIYCLPEEMYSNLFNSIQGNKLYNRNKKKNLVCFLRKEKSRNFENEDQIKMQLTRFAHKCDLNPVFINPSIETIDNIIEILSNAKYIFGTHGGAMYNILFAEKDATIIEFITCNSTDSLMHMVRSFGQDYIPFAVDSSKSSPRFEINKSNIEQIFDSLIRKS